MARRSSSRTRNRYAGPRSPNSIARRSLVPAFHIRPLDLRVFEDRRSFYPERVYRPALSTSRRGFARVRERAALPRPSSMLRDLRFQFAVPQKVIICVRRKQRREVLHALGKTRGGSGRKRRNSWSNVSC